VTITPSTHLSGDRHHHHHNNHRHHHNYHHLLLKFVSSFSFTSIFGITNTLRHTYVYGRHGDYVAQKSVIDDTTDISQHVKRTLRNRYDTVIVAHRMTSEPRETLRKLEGFASGGGHVFITASSVLDLGGTIANVSVGACAGVASGAVVNLANGSNVHEPGPFVQCAIAIAAGTGPGLSVETLATLSGQPAALRVAFPSGGTITVVGAGNYAVGTNGNAGATYSCSVDEADSADKNAFSLVAYAEALLTSDLTAAALFDLGPRLSWVPKRLADGRYALVVTNSELLPVPLKIKSRTGDVANVEEV
jgi:hypothetical protein